MQNHCTSIYMENLTPTHMLYLPLILFSVLTAISPSTLARILRNSDYSITFFIDDVLKNTSPSSPFSEPNSPFTLEGVSPHSTSVASVSWPPLLTSLRTLESGTVTVIEEELRGNGAVGSLLIGKLQGIYVTSSENNTSQMVAIRATFGNGRWEDSLRFFGEHRPDLRESHIAVVGGTGRFRGANGFAVVKAVGSEVGGRSSKRKLLFTVHIK